MRNTCDFPFKSIRLRTFSLYTFFSSITRLTFLTSSHLCYLAWILDINTRAPSWSGSSSRTCLAASSPNSSSPWTLQADISDPNYQLYSLEVYFRTVWVRLILIGLVQFSATPFQALPYPITLGLASNSERSLIWNMSLVICWSKLVSLVLMIWSIWKYRNQIKVNLKLIDRMCSSQRKTEKI